MIFSKLFSKFKNLREQVNLFETKVTESSMSFAQILEKNAALEQEITARMEELQQANKSILTLQNIWSTMNSSEPLNEVLRTIAQGMTQNLGYENAVIFQLFGEGPEAYLKIRENALVDNMKELVSFLHKDINDFSVSALKKNNILIQAINSGKITIVKNFEDLFKETRFAVSTSNSDEVKRLIQDKAMVIIPIVFQSNILPLWLCRQGLCLKCLCHPLSNLLYFRRSRR